MNPTVFFLLALIFYPLFIVAPAPAQGHKRKRSVEDANICNKKGTCSDALAWKDKLLAATKDLPDRDIDPNNKKLNAKVRVRPLPNSKFTRTELMHAILTPADVRDTRAGSFSPTLKKELFTALGGHQKDDEAGHVLSNILGGPNTELNFFPQHSAVNRNKNVVQLGNDWYNTELHIKDFLRGVKFKKPEEADDLDWDWEAEIYENWKKAPLTGRTVDYTVALHYEDKKTGRPTHLSFVAIYMSNGQEIYEEKDENVWNGNTGAMVRKVGGAKAEKQAARHKAREKKKAAGKDAAAKAPPV